jgi:hypothetical protein
MINKLTLTEKMRIFSFSILFIFIATILLQPAAVLGTQPGETVTDATVPAGPQEKPSSQEKSVSVPKVLGMNINQARLTLEKVGLRLKLAKQPATTKKHTLVGKVAKQHPSAHSQLSPGSDVLVAPYILKR